MKQYENINKEELNLFIVKYKVSIEHVWATTRHEAEEFAKKHSKSGVWSVDIVYGAATTKDYPTPPGLQTFRVVAGASLPEKV